MGLQVTKEALLASVDRLAVWLLFVGGSFDVSAGSEENLTLAGKGTLRQTCQ